MIIDKGSENEDAVRELAQRYAVKRVLVSAYQPQANEMIERGHKLIADDFTNISDGEFTNLARNLPAVFWAD